MELWMKIAFAVMTVMSAMGFVAFIIVLRHVIPKSETIEHGWGTRMHSGRHPWAKRTIENRLDMLECNITNLRDISECRIGDIEARLDDINTDFKENLNKIDGIPERFASDERAMDNLRGRIEALLQRVNKIEYHQLLVIEDKMNRQKKRIKELEKKEG